MATIYETRVHNLRRLVRERGGAAKVSKLLHYANASYLSQLIGPKQHRNIAERTARNIEQHLNLPVGWLDQTYIQSSPHDASLLEEALKSIAQALSAAELTPTPSKLGEIVILVYEHALATGKINITHVRRIVNLIKA